MPKDCNTKKVNLGIIGVTGRVGKSVLKCALEDHFSVVFGTASENSTSLGYDLGSLIDSSPLNIYVEKNRLASYDKADVIIDFSLSDATSENIQRALISKKPLVIGTTALSAETKALIEKAKEEIPLLVAPNFSLGIQLCLQTFRTLSKNADRIEIFETHHKTKKDSPSGTSLMLAEALNLKPESIHSIRNEDSVGEHKIVFHLGKEQITLTHNSLSRDIYAHGALCAAHFLLKQKPGLYTLKELLQ